MQIPVTVVTQNASQDDQSDTDYREMYQELRENYSLRDFVALVTSARSIAFWSKCERGIILRTELTAPDILEDCGVRWYIWGELACADVESRLSTP